MRNKKFWKPSKFIHTVKGWSPSSDRRRVGVGSRFVASVQLKHYLKHIREHASGKLLDLGCGEVPYYGIYSDLVTENICVDWSNNLFLDFVLDINKKFPLPDTEFDSILCTDVLEHVYDPCSVFTEIARVLKPGGKLILCVPFLYYLHEEPYDYFRYTEHRLRRFGEDNKLEPLLLYPYGGALEIILDILAKNISSNLLLSAIHLKLSLAFMNSQLGIAVYRRTSHRFPLGYCFVARKTLE